MAYAIDRNLIIKDVFLGHARVSDVPFMPDSWMYEPASHIYSYDINKAREILNGDGWADLNNDGIFEKQTDEGVLQLSFELVTNADNPVRQKMAELIAEQLKSIGMNVILKMVDWNELNKILNQKTFDCVLAGYELSNDGDLSFAFHSSSIAGNTNFISYNNPLMDSLLDDVLSRAKNEDKKQALSKLQKYIAEELPYISLFFRTSAIIYNARLKGQIEPSTTGIYRNIHEWYILE
jgi:peptide/nickel transport system substrate-binding protein